MHITNIPPVVNFACMSGVTAVAFIRGGPRERIVAVLIGASMLSGQLPLHDPLFQLAKDGVKFSVCFAATARSRSYWPVWASAAFLCNLIGDVLYRFDGNISWWSYVSAGWAFIYVAMAALLWGSLVYPLHAQEGRPWRGWVRWPPATAR